MPVEGLICVGFLIAPVVNIDDPKGALGGESSRAMPKAFIRASWVSKHNDVADLGVSSRSSSVR